ncbi:hypothetical protein [Neisseria lactamica]|uniref:hypothetical protein n=1 Tax=Neisseria lactamica TaxID=486 RepID=UPI001EE06CC3|nr:hypothetical protein [Neisseria lactamica]
MPSEPVFRRHFVDGMCGLVPYAQSVLSGYAVWYLGFGTVGYKGAERYDMPLPVLENTYPAGSKMPSEKAFQTAFVR